VVRNIRRRSTLAKILVRIGGLSPFRGPEASETHVWRVAEVATLRKLSHDLVLMKFQVTGNLVSTGLGAMKSVPSRGSVGSASASRVLIWSGEPDATA
jgi:hypothetical protein